MDSNSLGFSASGTNMLFERNFVQNGDDCLTVGNGAKDIIFRSVVVKLSPIHTDLLERDSYCEGGHGLSIGSLGKGGQVADVQNVLSVLHFLYRVLDISCSFSASQD